MPSAKSVSASAPRNKWSLRKTLARKVSFRPIEDEDLAYVWAAYRKGALASMGGVFAEPTMPAGEFKDAFEAELLTNYHGAWTLFSETRRGRYEPIGLVLGFWSHPNPMFAPFMIVGDMIWFPWSSARNRIEAAVNFFHRIRSEIPMVEYARQKDRKFFVVMMRHGIMQQVGTSMNVYRDEPAAVYETRRPG